MKRLLFFLILSCGNKLYSQNYVYQVFDNLSSSFGQNRGKPKLKIVEETWFGLAVYLPEEKEIRLNKSVISFCRKFEKDSINALAIILGHELAHYYKQHEWCIEYAYLTRNSSLGGFLRERAAENKKLNEIEADKVGLMAVVIGGYYPVETYAELLDTIYNEYKIEDKILNYPSKEERKLLLKSTLLQISNFQTVSNSAILLYYLKEYDSAIMLYNYLLRDFPSRELYSNLGKCYIEKATQFNNVFQMPFIIQNEIDAISRMQNASIRGGSISDDSLVKYIDLAKINLLKAIVLDNKYNLAYLNLAQVHILEKNYEASIGVLNSIKTNDIYLLNQIANLKSIAYFLNNDIEKAHFWQSKIVEPTNSQSYNAQIIERGYSFFENKAELSKLIALQVDESEIRTNCKASFHEFDAGSIKKEIEDISLQYYTPDILQIQLANRKIKFQNCKNESPNKQTGIFEKQQIILINSGEIWLYTIE